MSRDRVIEKMSINVTYDTDIELARKLVKKIGQQLAEDPEFGSSALEPLKMQGVDSFGDFAMVIRIVPVVGTCCAGRPYRPSSEGKGVLGEVRIALGW